MRCPLLENEGTTYHLPLMTHQGRATSTPRFIDILFQPDMIKIFVASLFILGQVLVSFSLIPLFIAARGGSSFTIGLHTTVFAVASVLLRFVFGPLADVRGRKLALAIGSFVFATAHLLIYFAPTLEWMLVARVYQAVGMASYLSSASSLVADLAPTKLRGSAIGAYRMIMPFASLIGPFLGNEVIIRYGFQTFFLIAAAAAFFSFLVVCTLQHGKAPIAGTVAAITPRDIASIFTIADLRLAYLGILLVSIGGGIVNTYITAYGAPYFSNAAIYFLVYAGFGATAAFSLGRLSDRVGRFPVVVPVLLAMVIGLFILNWIDPAPNVVFILSAIGTGIGFNAGLSVLISWIVDASPLHLRGTALSLQESWIDTGFAIGIFAFGSLSIVLSHGTLFAITGAVVGVGTLTLALIRGTSQEKNDEQ